MSDDFLARKILELANLFKEYEADGFDPEIALRHGDFPKAERCANEIVDLLMCSPGILTHFKDNQTLKEAQRAIDALWGDYIVESASFVESLTGWAEPRDERAAKHFGVHYA